MDPESDFQFFGDSGSGFRSSKKNTHRSWIRILSQILSHLEILDPKWNRNTPNSLQVVLTNISSASNRGEYDDDACFYNSLCSHFMFGFPDFNHVFSNVAYAAFGALLVLITVCRRCCLKAPGGHQSKGLEVLYHLGCMNVNVTYYKDCNPYIRNLI